MTSPRRPPALLVNRELELDVIGAAFLASYGLNTSDDLSARRAVAGRRLRNAIEHSCGAQGGRHG